MSIPTMNSATALHHYRELNSTLTATDAAVALLALLFLVVFPWLTVALSIVQVTV